MTGANQAGRREGGKGGIISFTMNNNPKQDSEHMLNEPGEKERGVQRATTQLLNESSLNSGSPACIA